MNCSFRAYIDETGDEGFVFKSSPDQQGSTDWFVLTAFVVAKQLDVSVVKELDTIKTRLRKEKSCTLHWRTLDHARKTAYSKDLGQLPVEVVNVCCHKPSLRNRTAFQKRNVLYYYAARYLLERLSWIARDWGSPPRYGDGTVELMFSDRSSLRCTEITRYLEGLKEHKRRGEDIRIEFDRLCLDPILAMSPRKSMGLQLADGYAGTVSDALERNRFGDTEARYVKYVLPKWYRHGGSLSGYGFKVMPVEAVAFLDTQASRGIIERFW